MKPPRTTVITNPIDIANQLDMWLIYPLEDDEEESTSDTGVAVAKGGKYEQPRIVSPLDQCPGSLYGSSNHGTKSGGGVLPSPTLELPDDTGPLGGTVLATTL